MAERQDGEAGTRRRCVFCGSTDLWLYERREPLPQFHVWLAPYMGGRYVTYYKRAALGLSVPNVVGTADYPDGSNMYGATLGVGQLALQIMTSTLPGLGLQHGPSFPVFKVWPARGTVTVYPRPALTDEGLLAFSDAFESSTGPVTRHVA